MSKKWAASVAYSKGRNVGLARARGKSNESHKMGMKSLGTLESETSTRNSATTKGKEKIGQHLVLIAGEAI